MMFAEEVYRVVQRVPAGKVTTYAAVARALGTPGAARAVGRALAANPFSYCRYTTERSAKGAGGARVPCHRVVRSSGRIGGYTAGGRSAVGEKIGLLTGEGVEVSAGKINLRKFGWRAQP